MAFCRRCGEIVSSSRCKCGGAAVAPVVSWNQLNSTEQSQDRWSNTYVHRERSISPMRPVNTHSTGSTASSPTKRFPRPGSTCHPPGSALANRISAHIASTTSHSNRPPSPLKHASILPAPEEDILPSLSPHITTLSKVYGSVLQPKESLKTYSCAVCSAPFPPDATIYPDPSVVDASRFLCRPCFTTNGGSKGICPTCSRPVLTLKSEGGFIHVSGTYWHKRCFNCSGCFKNIGDSPMVDLLGHPSCAQCFENCLKRDPSTPKKYPPNNPSSPKTNNLGGMSSNSKARGRREGSPAIEELEQRLGIAQGREGSPALEELSQRLSMVGRGSGPKPSPSGNSPTVNSLPLHHSGPSRESSPLTDRHDRIMSPSRRYERFQSSDADELPTFTSGSPSPVRPRKTASPAPTTEAIEEMKQRFMKGPSSSPNSKAPTSTTPLRRPNSSTSLRLSSDSKIPAPIFYNESFSHRSPSIPQTPDLVSDSSDTATQSSFSPDSPPRDDEVSGDLFNLSKVYASGYGSRYTRGDFLDDPDGKIAEETTSQMGTPTHTPKATGASKKSPTHTPLKALVNPASNSSPSPLTKWSSMKPLAPNPQSDRPSSAELSPLACCADCGGNLFSVQEGGKYITVPGDENNPQPKTYHAGCFRCTVCHDIFREVTKGRAAFVKGKGGPCHVECAPPTKITIHTAPGMGPLRSSLSNPTMFPSTPITLPSSQPLAYQTSSRFDPSHSIAPSASTPFPRFGSRIVCPGCHKSVSPMERGVVPGPQGSRWHASCLVCGGKKEIMKGWRNREEKKEGEPGCGKKLDSAAKSGNDGGIWCRECLLLLGVGGSPQGSPTRAPLMPTHTGPGKVAAQLTGTTTLARQFTGLGGGEPGLLRHLTGGGLSPTRSISPTKQLGRTGVGTRSRPKSVIGMRSAKSVDEGRGMFLVRQLTGASSNARSELF